MRCIGSGAGTGGRAREIVLALLAVTLLAGASAAPSESTAKATHPSPAAASTPAQAPPGKLPGAQRVINFLSETIGWYRGLAVQERMAEEPAEVLYVADQRQLANEILDLSFDYARAQAQLLAKLPPHGAVQAAAPAGPPPAGSAVWQQLAQRAGMAQRELNAARRKVEALEQRIKTAGPKTRGALASQLAAAQGELDLDQARSDALGNLTEFESGKAGSQRREAGLLGEIDELDKSVRTPERNLKAVAPPAAAMQQAEPAGIIGLVESLFALDRKLNTIGDAIDATTKFADSANALRRPLIEELSAIDRRGGELARQPAFPTAAAALRRRQQDFQALIELRKLVAAAAIPLTKQSVVLGLYTDNLAHWRSAVGVRSARALRRLVIRLVLLGLLLGLVFVAAALWRRFTFRYVQDVRRRHQLLQARRLVLALVVALVLLLNFANELGTVATVMGFAAAGIALALQNVILSVAGYFFLIGKFGIKAGDRVQVSGVTGDVIDIGLVKLTLLELGSSENERQPTGRVVVFSNAVVFQPSGNFFKQVPGTSFVWNQISFTLAPDCDYQLAEKRLLEAVDEVFARYRDRIQRQYRQMEMTLNMAVEPPRPQSRLCLDQSGLQVVIRYPTEMRAAVETADEVSRRLLESISREPTLKLVGQATPNIQAATLPPADGPAPPE
jgi:small-conductance mechanosensitive channel